VAARTRLWFVVPGGTAAQQDALARALGRRALAAVVSAPDADARACGVLLAAAAELELRVRDELCGADERALNALSGLACEHPGAEIAVAASRDVLQAALSTALGFSIGSAARVKIQPGGLCAFDWPAERTTSSAPVLAGADLDWLPPWTPKQARNPYPGGPGAAGTARG
jgi:hypothetical protein